MYGCYLGQEMTLHCRAGERMVSSATLWRDSWAATEGNRRREGCSHIMDITSWHTVDIDKEVITVKLLQVNTEDILMTLGWGKTTFKQDTENIVKGRHELH